MPKRLAAQACDDLVIGLQLTHSGRFCKPVAKDLVRPPDRLPAPGSRPPRRPRSDDHAAVLTDGGDPLDHRRLRHGGPHGPAAGLPVRRPQGVPRLPRSRVLSAHTWPGPYGGDFEGRTAYLREIVAAVRSECPDLEIGIRLSLFDAPPFRPDPARSQGGKLGPGIPDLAPDSPRPFGASADDPLGSTSPSRSSSSAAAAGRTRRCGSSTSAAALPYYNPHFQRPAFHPPRTATSRRKIRCSVVRPAGSRGGPGREAGPPRSGARRDRLHRTSRSTCHVAQAVLREEWVDSIGIGRLVLSDWQLPASGPGRAGLRGGTRRSCRTFSDCTTAPRNGIISGCYPLDDYYKPPHRSGRTERPRRTTSASGSSPRQAETGSKPSPSPGPQFAPLHFSILILHCRAPFARGQCTMGLTISSPSRPPPESDGTCSSIRRAPLQSCRRAASGPPARRRPPSTN